MCSDADLVICEDRVRLNVYYVKHKGIGLDIHILLRTIPAVITGDGAY